MSLSDDAADTVPTPEPAAQPDPGPTRRRGGEVLHIKRAWNGTKTVAEAWSEGLDPRAKCLGCGQKGGLAVWIRTYYPLDDFLRIMGPIQSLLYARKHGGKLPIMETIFGPVVFVAEVYACKSCGPSAEIAAAKHPSYALVEVRKAPRDVTVVQVPRGARL